MPDRMVYSNLSVRVPPEILRELHRLKAETGRSVNELVVEALKQYIAAQWMQKGSTAE